MSTARTLGDYWKYFQKVKKLIIKDYSFTSSPEFSEVVKYPRMVVVVNHSTPLSWLPAMFATMEVWCTQGGAHILPLAIIDKEWYSNPILKPAAVYLSQSKKPQTFNQLLEKFSTEKNVSIFMMPEGAHSFFGNPSEIQPFRSNKFIELAIRANAPIYIVAHKGTEDWIQQINLPKSLIKLLEGSRLSQTVLLKLFPFFFKKVVAYRHINFPLAKLRTKDFKISAQLYWPELKTIDISEDFETKKSQLAIEAAEIKRVFESLLR